MVSTTEAAVAVSTTGEEEVAVVVVLAALATWATEAATVEDVEVAGAVVAVAWAAVTWAVVVVVVARGVDTTTETEATEVVASAGSPSSHRDRAVDGDIKLCRHHAILYCLRSCV